jgi:two-component system response regulator HydG
MPYGNANELTERLLREQILPRRKHTPIVAGVMASDPTRAIQETLVRLREMGVQGITNWPAIGFVDGQLRQMLEQGGWGLDAEVKLLREAGQYGLAAFGFALEPAAASRFAQAGSDAIILDLGLTRSLEDVRERRDQLQQAIVRLQGMLAAVKESGRSPLLLVFGGPVASADDFEQVLRQCAVDGFAGGSIFERLPVQDVVMATVRRFKSIAIAGGNDSANRLEELIGASPPMKEIFRLIQQIAPYDVNVCIEGETGTGKELVASLLHRHSARRHRPFITLNCGAIPETLLESELFGHEKGAFTGAHRQRLGKFELATGGTLFLDEIADLSPHGQVALLRAIQQREITRVGGEKPIPVDVRIITASHQSLPAAVQSGKFRADLFYRLNHFTLDLPPLRERKEDLPLLSEAILARLNVELARQKKGINPRFLQKLESHFWPGNVRELEHVMRQAAVLEDGAVLTGRFFTPQLQGAKSANPAIRSTRLSRETRHESAKRAVASFNGNKSHAAASLGITRKTLYAWLSAREE